MPDLNNFIKAKSGRFRHCLCVRSLEPRRKPMCLVPGGEEGHPWECRAGRNEGQGIRKGRRIRVRGITGLLRRNPRAWVPEEPLSGLTCGPMEIPQGMEYDYWRLDRARHNPPVQDWWRRWTVAIVQCRRVKCRRVR